MNYCELLFNTPKEHLDKEALIDAETGKRLSYKRLQENVKKVAGFFSKKGYTPGTVILTHLHNSVEAAIVLLAAQYQGCVICPVNPLYKPLEINYYVKDSGAKCLITYLNKAELQIDKEMEIEVLNVSEIEALCEVEDFPEDMIGEMYSYKEDELAMLLYTSGSTSEPKGVMLTTECFYTFLRKSDIAMYRYSPLDRLLCFVPFSHGYGSVSLLIPALAGKAAIVFLRSFQPIKIAKIISSENITHIFGVPTHYQQMLRYEMIFEDLKKLKAAFCAAAPLNFETALLWYKSTGVYLDEGYGMTETSTLISTRMSMLPEPSGNVGFAPEGILKVEAFDEDGSICPNGIIGELRVKGEGIMPGYYNRPDESREKFRDGWFCTGDFGYKRDDGSIVISGRKNEIINVAGLKISPVEIEAVINSHIAVADSAVVGVEDGTYGQIIKAFVVLKENFNVSERDLIKYVSDKIANFKVPKFIYFLDELPRNKLGKIDKNMLKSY